MAQTARAGKGNFLFYLIIFFLLLLILWLLYGNKIKRTLVPAKDWEEYVMKDPAGAPAPEPHKQLVVYLKPGTQRRDFNRWIEDSLVTQGDVFIRYVCRSCDSTLFLFEGSGVERFMMEKLLLSGGGVAKGGNGTRLDPEPAGETNHLYYTSNVRIKAEPPASAEADIPLPEPPDFRESPVKVAVFDTGLDTAKVPYRQFNASTDNCIPGAETGWNFMDNDNRWNDDYSGQHGTVVTRFLTNEVFNAARNGIELLPVKIFNSIGNSDFFSMLCAFAYASHQGVQLINASFGYYESVQSVDLRGNVVAAEGTPSDLLRTFVEKYLTQKNILLIAAAGNKIPAEDNVYMPEDPVNQRNLDSVHFYPASLSRLLPNVIAVTTAYDSFVSPRQNFSNKVVDISVHADIRTGETLTPLNQLQNEISIIRSKINLPWQLSGIDSNFRAASDHLSQAADEVKIPHFMFASPLTYGSFVEGSSFAAPVVAGKLTAYYYLYQDLLNNNQVITNQTRDSIFQRLSSNPDEGFLYKIPGLISKVKEGKIIVRYPNRNNKQRSAAK
ncbi:MAG: S8/S53 family peptidase [Chitinophagaceae bacterium]|nr:S8/S53 family peptidase [Chitinophagaceae bacterium]MCW5929581.1 S8/S53 family peptidase [Chitinophagaceae bacterium]